MVLANAYNGNPTAVYKCFESACLCLKLTQCYVSDVFQLFFKCKYIKHWLAIIDLRKIMLERGVARLGGVGQAQVSKVGRLAYSEEVTFKRSEWKN